MRLICPRCGAQYEVDDSVIPAAGRDVQCSGCGQTWFQPSHQMLETAPETAPKAEAGLAQWDLDASQVAPEAAADPEPEAWPEPQPEDWPDFDPAQEAESTPTVPDPPAPAPEPSDWAVPTVPAPAEPEPADLDPAEVEADVTQAIAELMRAHPLSPPADPEDEAPAEPTPPLPPGDLAPAPRAGAIPRRPLDENLMAILREEAAREAAARRAEGTGIETQEEMNLDPVLTSPVAPAAPVQPQRVTPTLRAEPRRVPDFSDLNSAADDDADDIGRPADLAESPDPGPETAETTSRFPRRQRLPDIDEINSSLRASADRTDDIAAMGSRMPTRQDDRSGFSLGFSTVLLLAAAAALVYAYAPQLAGREPALAPVLDSYVATVDAMRLWLDAQLRAVIDAVRAGTQQG